MSKGYFANLDIDNEKEILVIDTFIKEVQFDYIGKQRNGSPIPLDEIKKPISSKLTEYLTTAGLISAFVMLVLLYNNANHFLALFSMIALVGYGYSFVQLKRSEDFVESVRTVQKDVHDYKQTQKKLNNLKMGNNVGFIAKDCASILPPKMDLGFKYKVTIKGKEQKVIQCNTKLMNVEDIILPDILYNLAYSPIILI